MEVAQPPKSRSIPKLRAAAAGCTACPLYAKATQTVFGEGAPHGCVLSLTD